MKNVNRDESLYKAFGVLWQPHYERSDYSWLVEQPLCPNESCHTPLDSSSDNNWHCIKCNKYYPCNRDFTVDRNNAQKMWEGYKTLDWTVYSLELSPTKILSNDEDENYWVQARLTEKSGKRVAVIYFGEKIRGEQNKTDYTQLFIDLEDEQLRFDKNNKNPMNILTKLTAEFKNSIIAQIKKEE